MPKILVNDASSANLQALQSLNSGADGIFFELHGSPDVDAMLKKIELPYCQTAFLASIGHEKFIHNFCALVKTKKIDPASIGGAIFWKQAPAIPNELMEWFNGWKQFHVLGIVVENPTSPSGEIADLLAQAVKQIDNSAGRGTPVQDAVRAVAFSVSLSTDFFLEIAKLKVLRMLWLLVANAYGARSSSVFIHASSRAWENIPYEPHGNMLKATVCSLSATLGGCDALTVEEANPNDPTMARVALNVSSILREESRLGKVSDPTAGSYFLENLVYRLGQEAWKKFQALVNS